MVLVEYDYDARIFGRENELLFLFLNFECPSSFDPLAEREGIISLDILPFFLARRFVVERHERSKVHEGCVYLASRDSGVLEIFLDEEFFLFGEFLEASSIIVPRKNLVEICIEAEYGHVVDKSLNGCCSIRPDS